MLVDGSALSASGVSVKGAATLADSVPASSGGGVKLLTSALLRASRRPRTVPIRCLTGGGAWYYLSELARHRTNTWIELTSFDATLASAVSVPSSSIGALRMFTLN